MKKVSIIVPYLKGPSYLLDCITSIHEQGLEDYEIVLLDDKDGDEVPEEIKVMPTVTYVRLEDEIEEYRTTLLDEEASASDDEGDSDDGDDSSGDVESAKETLLMPFGVAAARNLGIEKATGEYVYFLDADDYLLPNSLLKLLEVAQEKSAKLVTGGVASSWFKPSSFDWENTQIENQIQGIHPLEGEILKTRFSTRFSAQHLLIERSILVDHEVRFDRDNTFYSDMPFVIKVLALTKGCAYVDGDNYYIWRRRNDPVNLPALCQKKRKRRGREFIESYDQAMSFLGKENNEIRYVIENILCKFSLQKFPVRIKGAVAINFTEHLCQIQNKSVFGKFKLSDRLVLFLLRKQKYRFAKPIVKAKKSLSRKKGIFGKPIQYYRFIDRVIFKKLKIQEDLVLFESFFGKSYSDSPKYLYEYMQKTRGDRYRYVIILNQKSKMLKQVDGKVKTVKRFSLRHVYYASRAKYQIYNTRQPYWLSKREGMVFLETWHGTPLKKLVFDLDDIHSASQNHKTMFRKQDKDWDYLVSANRFSTDVFERAFAYERQKIIEVGYPRNDILNWENREDIAREVKNELSIPTDKRVIMYAPTWRDNQFYGKGQYKFQLEMDLERMKKEFGKDSVLLLRTHYYIADQLSLEGLEDFVYNGSKYEDISRLYLISDICITDYSSVFFDYANLKRPILFFAYDYEDYKEEIRGLYINMEKDLPGPIIQTNDELVDALHHMDRVTEEYRERYEVFYERFCSLDDGHACQRTIDQVFGTIEQ